MTLHIEPRLVEALVEHAKGGGKPKPAETPTEPASVAAPDVEAAVN
jgi:hypothetical protein